jgi:hypothetical protein
MVLDAIKPCSAVIYVSGGNSVKKPSALVVAVIAIFGMVLVGKQKNTVFASRLLEARDSRANSDALEQQIVAKEREGLDALKTGNVEIFANLTAEEAVFVDAAGLATKAEVMKNVAGFTLTDYSTEDVRFVPLSKASGLISYKIHEKGVSHGHEFTAQAYVSSIWAQRAGKWFCLFSQETAARMPPKQPS